MANAGCGVRSDVQQTQISAASGRSTGWHVGFHPAGQSWLLFWSRPSHDSAEESNGIPGEQLSVDIVRGPAPYMKVDYLFAGIGSRPGYLQSLSLLSG